jgi:hypothetical protein
MKFKVHYIVLLCCGLLQAAPQILFAQQRQIAEQKPLVQVSGIIQNANTQSIIPYVTIRNVSFRDDIFSANHQGYFSFVAHPGDTIRFHSLGYTPVDLVIPQDLRESKYTASVRMSTEIIELEEVEVYPYPWASIDEFNLAFMALDLADDDIITAKKNLSAESLAQMAAVTPMNATEMRTFQTNQAHIGLSNKAVNQKMANPLLSPFAWGNFIRQISEGNKSRARNNW